MTQHRPTSPHALRSAGVLLCTALVACSFNGAGLQESVPRDSAAPTADRPGPADARQDSAADAQPPADQRAPDTRRPDVRAPDTLAHDVRSPDILAPDVLAPDILAPDILAPDLLAPDQGITDPTKACKALFDNKNINGSICSSSSATACHVFHNSSSWRTCTALCQLGGLTCTGAYNTDPGWGCSKGGLPKASCNNNYYSALCYCAR